MNTRQEIRRTYKLTQESRQASAVTVDNKLAEMRINIGGQFSIRNLEDVQFVIKFLTSFLEDVDRIEAETKKPDECQHLPAHMIEAAEEWMDKAAIKGFPYWKLKGDDGNTVITNVSDRDPVVYLIQSLMAHCINGKEYLIETYNKKREKYKLELQIHGQ